MFTPFPEVGGPLSSLSDKLGEVLAFVRKGFVLSPLNTDPGAGRGFPNGFVDPLGNNNVIFSIISGAFSLKNKFQICHGMIALLAYQIMQLPVRSLR